MLYEGIRELRYSLNGCQNMTRWTTMTTAVIPKMICHTFLNYTERERIKICICYLWLTLDLS